MAEQNQKRVQLNLMPQLEGLRALCLLSIVVYHWTVQVVHLPLPFEIGAFVFFALSGYLITRILLRGKKKWSEGTTSFGRFMRSFTMRRILRLIPAYFVALVLYLLVGSTEVWENFGWYASNTSNIHFARTGSWPGGADQFWTLAVDQQFYAFWPFLILLLPTRSLPAVLVLVAALAPASRYFSHFGWPCFSGPMDDKLPWFLTDYLCFGALLAYLHESKRLPTKRILWILSGVSLVLYLVMRYRMFGIEDGDVLLILQQTLLAAFSTCLVGLCVYGMGGLGQKVLEHPVMQYIGKRSYGYYVYHNLALLILGKVAFFLFPSADEPDYLYPVRFVLAGYILYLLAHYSWRFIEEPLMKRKEKHKYQHS